MASDQKKREAPGQDEQRSTGLEGAAERKSGILREEEEIEGGEGLSLGGGPPKAAGGEKRGPLPTQGDVKRS